MKVKFTKLAALLLAGAALFATGCTDYEVDIQKNADAIASANQQISALQTALNSLQSTHSTDVAALNKAISDLETSLKALIDKKADKEALEAAVARIKAIEDADFQAQIDALTAKDQEIEKTIADLKVLFADEIAKLDTRLKAAEAAIKEINEVTIPAIKEQIKALQAKDAQHDETLKLLSDYVKNLQDLTAGFPEGTTIKKYIDEQDSSLKDFLLKELEKYATKAELAEVEARLDARLKTLETLTAGFPEGTTIKKYIDDQVTAINNAIADLQAAHDADVADLQAAIDKVKAEVLSVKQAIRSLVFVPEVYVDGVEAILVSTLHYTPLELKDTNTVNENAVAVDTVINVTPPAIAKYHVVPSNADLTFLEVGDTVKFVVRADDPFITTRATATEDFDVVGIYMGRDTVETDCINVKVEVTGLPATDKNISVVALQLTKGEETYTSDYATVYSQDVDDVRIADPTNEEDDDAHYRRATEVISGTDNEAFLNNVVVWTDEFDTLSCDHQMAYDEPFDVQKYVIAHFIEGQECLPNEKTFEGLGFTWQFELVEDYDFCDNKLFTLTEEGVLTCKDGNAINNTPIVRVTIKDGDNNVQIAYVKVWVAPSDKEADIIWSKGDKGEVKDQFEFKCEGDTLIADSTVLYKEVLNLFPITLKNFNAAYPTFVAAVDEKVDTLGTVVYDPEKGELQWIMTAEEIWKIASDPNLKEGDIPVIEHNVAFKADNNAQVVVKLVADVKPVDPYKIPIERYIPNYWTENFDFTLYNVATPAVGETDSTKCVFVNNINASFYTDSEGVIDLEGIGMENVEITSIEYFFCKDMEGITKIDGIDVKFSVNEKGDSLFATVKDTTECIAVIDNAYTEKDKTPNVAILNKESDVAKLLLNTCPGLDELGNPKPGELYVLLGAYGIICGDEDSEGFKVNLLWKEDKDGKWVDHFAAKYRQPVLLSDGAADIFIDAVDFGEGGSFITIKDLINPMDWRARFFDPQKDENFVVKDGQVDGIDYFSNYWEYYGEIKITVDTAAIKCTLGFNGEEIDLPVTVDVKVVETADDLKGLINNTANTYRDKNGKAREKADGSLVTIEEYIDSLDAGDFGFLTYHNNLTNVTEDFDLHVPVEFRYGWGVLTKVITVHVFKTPESFMNRE